MCTLISCSDHHTAEACTDEGCADDVLAVHGAAVPVSGAKQLEAAASVSEVEQLAVNAGLEALGELFVDDNDDH